MRIHVRFQSSHTVAAGALPRALGDMPRMSAAADTATLSRQRRFVTPLAGETLDGLAARALPDVPQTEAADRIRSWNLHIFAMRQPPGLLLCSDVVFVESPLA